MIEPEPASEYALIIVGSGPAGMTLAHELITVHKRADILMIESGGFEFDPAVQDLALPTATGDLPGSYFRGHSTRMFGGASNVWAGFCAVLEKRAFTNGEWPIDYDDLLPYYERALPLLELPPDTVKRPSVPLSDSSTIVYKPFYLSPPVRFGQKFRDFVETTPDLDLMMHTTVVAVEHESGVATGVRVRRANGTENVIKGRQIVLACGGIENPRLLLQSGLGKSGPVGQYFMEHPNLYSYGEVILQPDVVALSHEVSGMRVHAWHLSDAFNIETGNLGYSISMNELRGDRGLSDSQHAFVGKMAVSAEMAPQIENRIELAKSTDALGIPRAAIHFKFNFAEEQPRLWRLMGERFVRENVGRFTVPHEDFSTIGGGHFMGTTRMGTKDEGCVNTFGEMHDCTSLYIAGSSVFPAAGVANPTYTIVALALRLADHLGRKTV